MFTRAIEQARGFTRPIHTLERELESEVVYPGAATLFFVNDEGIAITCRHVANVLMSGGELRNRYSQYKQQKDRLQTGGSYSRRLKELRQQYGFEDNRVCEIQGRFMNCVGTHKSIDFTLHPTYDLAIVRFVNPGQFAYTSHAIFIKDSSEIKQGSTLCRLGYPFPEFTNFQYNSATDQAEWTDTGLILTPHFPLEGMVTRFLADSNNGGQIYGIELSTPGLRGQSGGPLFSTDGKVCGMQFATKHLHLGFDMRNQEVVAANGRTIRVTNQPFLHVGYCIHVDIIKAFLRQHSITFYEE